MREVLRSDDLIWCMNGGVILVQDGMNCIQEPARKLYEQRECEFMVP